MSSRIKEDPNLRQLGESRVIVDPIIIVEACGGGTRFRLFPDTLKGEVNCPVGFGIILSDLIDHIAKHYSTRTGCDESFARTCLMEVLNGEDRLKDQNPGRGKQVGHTFRLGSKQ
jgi:hypothetical protein